MTPRINANMVVTGLWLRCLSAPWRSSSQCNEGTNERPESSVSVVRLKKSRDDHGVFCFQATVCYILLFT